MLTKNKQNKKHKKTTHKKHMLNGLFCRKKNGKTVVLQERAIPQGNNSTWGKKCDFVIHG